MSVTAVCLAQIFGTAYDHALSLNLSIILVIYKLPHEPLTFEATTFQPTTSPPMTSTEQSMGCDGTYSERTTAAYDINYYYTSMTRV